MIKITERRIATWDCTKCSMDFGIIEHLSSEIENVKVICPGCDTAYCLHWGSNGFETWVEDWETYAMRHSSIDKLRAKGQDRFE